MPQETEYLRNPIMRGFVEGWFETSDGVSLRYLRAGAGAPVIMIPGWSAAADAFSLNAPDLAQDHEVFVLEMRGHGFSQVPEHGAQIARLSADLAEFVDWLGAPKVSLVGHSMGSCVIWGYMELFGQDRIASAVFIDEAPALLANPEDTDDQVRRYAGNRIDVWDFYNRLRADFEGERHALFREYFKYGQQGFPAEVLAAAPDNYDELWSMVPPSPPKAGDFLSDLMFNHMSIDWRPMFPLIKVPCLLVTGDVSHITTPEAGAWMAETIPDCTWVRFSAEELGDHQLFQRSYVKFNAAVRELLDRGREDVEEPAADVVVVGDAPEAEVLPEDTGYNDAEAEAAPRRFAPMAQMIEIQKVLVDPRTLSARVRIADGAPLYTDEDPDATNRVMDLLPELADHACTGDSSALFGEVVDSTDVAHLLEHVSVELMARTQLAGDISMGRTRELEDDPRAYLIQLDCPDDVLTAAALSSAAWVMEWAFGGGGDPVPDVDGIVSGLVGLVSYLDNAAAPAEEPAPEAEPADDGAPVDEAEALEAEQPDASIEEEFAPDFIPED